ncbi:unnamed protein product [Caenorhabditis sp. 36 PRJEB53466]|nr:unnamed protein product [Caenorhabditis sp. 36 PRJEB53466]
MSKREKSNLSKVHTGLTSTTRLQISSTKSSHERTEDDVGDEMDVSLVCDECGKLVGGMHKLELLDCGHFYCVICAPKQPKEKHTSCTFSIKKTTAFARESSPLQKADHDGELSTQDQEGAKDKLRSSVRATKRTPHKPNSTRKRKRKTSEQLWYFLYLSRPVVVSMAFDATYSDLLSRLYLVLNLERSTHEIHLKIQKSSSDEADGEFYTPGESVPLEVQSSKVRLVELKIPRQKMLILEVEEKKRRMSAENPEKTAEKKRDSKEKEKKKSTLAETASQSRAEEPKSS